ncbi:MAG: PEP-CTERM sorting domain-containing protein [Rubrivivax sp.]
MCSTLFLACAGAQAVTVFSDDFEADTPKLNQFVFVNGWTVTDGSVDVVHNFGGIPGNTVDLDGSTSDAGLFTKSLSLMAGAEYTVSFLIHGSRRGGSDNVTVSLGSASSVLSLASGDTVNGSFTFTPGASQSYDLSFDNAGGDNVGALLKNVAVTTAIPEPQTYALMLAGLTAVGVAARRRASRASR